MKSAKTANPPLLKIVRVHFHPMKRHNDSINDHDIINLNKTYTINLLETETERYIRHTYCAS